MHKDDMLCRETVNNAQIEMVKRMTNAIVHSCELLNDDNTLGHE